MALIKGVGVEWALANVTLGITGSFKLQDGDHTVKSETDVIKDANGETVTKTYYDNTEEATFTYVPTGTSGSVNIGGQAIGTVLTITDTHSPWAGTNWIVEEFTQKRTNTGAARATVKLWRSNNITS